jgi:CMP-2-keto-3-deoxyoctulosonic acid synthetase
MPAVFHAKDMIENVVWKAIECGAADIVIALDTSRLVRVFGRCQK